MTIHYLWHPLHGRSLPLVRRMTRLGQPYVHCELPDATVARIPLWMTDAECCRALTQGPPQVSLDALVELRRLLDAVTAEHSRTASQSSPDVDDRNDPVASAERERERSV